MGKAVSALAAFALLFSTGLIGSRGKTVQAQTSAPVLPCNGSTAASPMQGHYTGPWHSYADYHFYALGYDIELQVTIDGTMDVSVAADGSMTGTVHASVDAPEYHGGVHDVASGTGTMDGQLQGTFSPHGSTLVLSNPIIHMKWGTFVGGGFTVNEDLPMPDYQFAIGGADCTSAQGTIAESGFPTMNIVDDAAGNITQVPGVGTADGTWKLTSDASSQFAQLSAQVDRFIAQANSLINDQTTGLTPGLVAQQIVQPLHDLENTIAQNPSVARCLLERLGAWESTAVPALRQRAVSLASTDLAGLREAGDALRSADELNIDCNIDLSTTRLALLSDAQQVVDAAFSSGSWTQLALAAREMLLLGGDSNRPLLQQLIAVDTQSAVNGTADKSASMTIARIAYVFGDDAGAEAAYQRAATQVSLFVDGAQKVNVHKKRKKKSSQPKKTKSSPTPTLKPTVTPTPTTRPKTMRELLGAGLTSITPTGSGSQTISWAAVPGATRYIVTATAAQDPQLLWSWSGTSTTATYGDTAIEGVAGSDTDGWPNLTSPPAYWSVLALDAQGRIIGGAFRVSV